MNNAVGTLTNEKAVERIGLPAKYMLTIEQARKYLGMDDKSNKVTLTVDQAGEILGLSRNSAYAAVKRGEIPSIIFGGRTIIPIVAFVWKLMGADKATESVES